MKTKTASASRAKSIKSKIIKTELPTEDIINIPEAYNLQSSDIPRVEIIKCISFQKFRYSGENRPGKKYQEKEFMTLKLSNLQEKVVRVVIICTDADNRELIHPNGLVGKDCHDGIYDKEYAVTKQFHIIKIPYLRTERMKTKKNQHSKILGVLSVRASHLPSPYRERCMSQCTAKYATSRDKFDTTKVCLGVIVTVESQPGVLNGSLHAISHVVRNASEKTALSILKLSSDTVPARTGAFIDIFTTEDGPAIEPDRYLVYVTYNSYDMDSWKSEEYFPGKFDLLYKRVITYRVPPFEPNPSLRTPIRANLHLECPQSNQYCMYTFEYIPEDMVIVDDQTFIRQKRSIEQDIKPSPKRLKPDVYDSDGSSEVIKANLKTKIKARHESSSRIGTVFIDSQGESPDEEEAPHYASKRKQHQMFSSEGPVFIRHQDPQTGEASFFLDMDTSKSNSASCSTATFVDGGNQYVIHFDKDNPGLMPEMKSVKGTGNIFQSNSEDLKVVATGYSDSVPANTVLVYTTNGDLSSRDSDTAMEIIHRLSNDGSMIFEPGENHISIVTSEGVPASVFPKHLPAQTTQKDPAPERRESVEMTNHNGQMKESKINTEYAAAVDRPAAVGGLQGTNLNSSIPPSNSQQDTYNPNSTSSSLAIPPLRRMLISNKSMSNASPWVVENAGDSENEYNNFVKTFEAPNKPLSIFSGKAKNEPQVEAPFTRSSDIFSAATTQTSSSGSHYSHLTQITEKRLHNQEMSLVRKESKQLDNCTAISEGSSATLQDDASVFVSSGLSSIGIAEALAENLPTLEIIEIAQEYIK